MASPPHLPTTNIDNSVQTDHTGSQRMQDTESYAQHENYFQPLNDHEGLLSEHTPLTLGSTPFVASNNTVFLEELSPTGVTPQSLSQQKSPMFEIQPDVTSSGLNHGPSSTDNCDHFTTFSSTPPNSSHLYNKSASETERCSPHLLLPSQEVITYTQSQIQLDQCSGHTSTSCSEQLPENSEAICWHSYDERAKSDLPSGTSVAPIQASTMNSIQGGVQELEKHNKLDYNSDEVLNLGGEIFKCIDISDPSSLHQGSQKCEKEDKGDCVSEKGLTPGSYNYKPSHLPDPPSLNNEYINVPVEDHVSIVNTKRSYQGGIKQSDLSSSETSFDMLLAPEMCPQVSDINVNQVEESDPSDMKPPILPEAKPGGSTDYIPVLYLQVTKTLQEDNQRAIDTNQSQLPHVFSASIQNEVCSGPSVASEHSNISTHELEDVKNNGCENLHGEQGLGKNQDNPPEVGPTSRKENIKKSSTDISQPVFPGLKTQQIHRTPHTVSAESYNSYYGSTYRDYQNADLPLSHNYSLHYSRAPYTWINLRGHWPQMGSEAQFYDQKYQKEEHKQKQHEQCTSEHSHNSQLRQMRCRDRSMSTDRNKTSTYWSENYTDYYNYGGWNPQGQYSNAYYQDYYYPCTYGYQTDFSKSNSQQYNTKPYNYEDWWRYDPRYDSSFDYDQFTQCQLSPCDQNDTESSHSGYSTQSMSSTNSQSSHFSWHSEQGWGYPIQQYTDYPHYDGNIQSPAHFVDHAHLEKESGKITVACSLKGPSTSEQFPFLHCCARFGPGGQLSVVLPNLPSEGKPALVQIHSTEVISIHSALSEQLTAQQMMLQGCRDQPELQGFPGPLIKHKTHKSEVLEFIRKKRQECLHNETLVEKQASCLIWKLMELICKHNGKLVGTDISHLLLRNSDSSSKISTSDLIDFSNEALSRTVENKTCDAESASQDDVWAISNDTEKDLQCFRELLIFGKKKDALETAISKGLWGHAFMLAGKMDSRACSNVMSKFIDSLAVNDSLRTFYQLMSGKMPSSATCCEIKDCGHWHIHLAMVLSNHTHFKHLHQKTITRMGDTLASQGCSVAASFCYMVVQLGTDTQSTKTDTCLFGVNSSFNSSLPALKYATNEAIQRTEIFEYALSLGFDSVHLYNFQIFKFIYACRLAEAGLYIQALQYCEVISKALLASGSGHSLTLISQIIELSTKMRYVDQQFKDIPEIELSSEPEWLISIRKLHCHILEELNTHGSKTQDTNLPMLETNSQGTPPTIRTLPSYQISLLTTEKPDQENYTPDVHLVPPASQDILEYRDKPMIPKSSQILDPTCFQLSKKAVPLSVSPIYQMSSHQENLNGSPVEESIQDKPPAVLEPQIQILPTDVMQPEGLVHTDDSNDLPNDDSSETNASTNTLVRSQPSPSTLEPTAGDLQSQSLSIVPKSTQHTLDPHTLPSAMLSCSKSVATESEILPQITAPNIEPTTLASPMSVATECEPLPWLISPYKESQTVPSTTLPSISLETEIKCVHPTISPTTETNMVASTLSSSMSLVQDSVCIPPSCGPCTDLNSLSSTVLPSSKSLPAKSESIPQLIVPLPVTPSFDHMGKRCQKHHPVTQPSVAVAPLQMVSDNNQCYYSTKQNLSSPEVQQVHPKTTPRLCPAFEPQSLHSAVSNGKSQRTDTVDSQAVPLLTVPLPASHILPPISKDYSAIQGQHAAETEIRPAQMSCLLVDSALGQTPPRLFSANPYSMGEKMAHSKQTHTLSKPLIPRLFVPQSLHPDPKDQKEAGGGWLSWLFGKKKEVCFPVDTGKSLVWDENLQRWVDPSEEKKKRKHELVHSKRVNRMTTEKLGELAEPHTKGLSSGMPILTSGPKRGYMATLNPVLMSNNTDTHFYTSSSISSCEPPMVKPANTYQTDRAISGHSIKQVSEHMGWKQSAPSMPYSPTSDDILEEIM